MSVSERVKNIPGVYYLLIIILVGTLVRLALFNKVSVNYDSGYYLYDSLKILEDQRPIVDYYSRSPLWHYLISVPLSFGYSPLTTGRIAMIGTSLVLGLMVYKLASEVHSASAGYIAMALFVLAPLTFIWGQWIKTEQAAALLAVCAVSIYISKIGQERIPSHYLLFVGIILGVAFLIRRVVIVHLSFLAIAAFVYRSLYHEDPISTRVVYTALPVFGAVITVLAGYATLSGFQTEIFLRLVNAHFIDWFPITRQSGPPTDNGQYYANIIDPLFFCQKCSERTIRILSETIMVSLIPTVSIYLYFSTYTKKVLLPQMSPLQRVGFGCLLSIGLIALLFAQPYTFNVFFLSIYIIIFIAILFYISAEVLSRFNRNLLRKITPLAGFLTGETVVVSLGTIVWVSYIEMQLDIQAAEYPIFIAYVAGFSLFALLISIQKVDHMQIRAVTDPQVMIIAGVYVTLIISYLVRDRVIFVGYYQDVLPFAAVLGGVTLAEAKDHVEWTKIFSILVVIMIVTATLVGCLSGLYISAARGGIQAPYEIDGTGTVSSVHEVGGEIEARTQPDDTIFTAQSLYALEANRQNAERFSRMYWWIKHHPEANRTTKLTEEISRQMESGDIKYVVLERRFNTVRKNSPDINQAFTENYCFVEDPNEKFAKLRSHLYEYGPDRDCRRPR